MDDKKLLRKQYLAKRNELSEEERAAKSKAIWEQLFTLPLWEQADCILLYGNYKSEVITKDYIQRLLQENKKRLYFPLVEGADIAFYQIKDMQNFMEGYQGIPEPNPQSNLPVFEKKSSNCLIIAPGTVFDEDGGRIGYGKGFYDRFFMKYPDIPVIALAFECQMAPSVPMQMHDRRMNQIITEKRIIECKSLSDTGGN